MVYSMQRRKCAYRALPVHFVQSPWKKISLSRCQNTDKPATQHATWQHTVRKSRKHQKLGKVHAPTQPADGPTPQDLSESESAPPPTQQNEDNQIGPEGGTSNDHDYWTINAGFITRHHVQPRTQLFTPTETNCPIPLRYIDCPRLTETSLQDQSEKQTPAEAKRPNRVPC